MRCCVKRKTRIGHNSYNFTKYFLMNSHWSTSKYNNHTSIDIRRKCAERQFTSQYTLRSENICARVDFLLGNLMSRLFNICIRRYLLTLCYSYTPSVCTMSNPLKTKHRLLYLKTQYVPRSKHFSSRLRKHISLCCKWYK